MPKNIVDIDRDTRASDRSRETTESSIVSRVGAGLSSAASGVRSLFSKKSKSRHQRSRRLGMEDLEGRMLLSTFSSTSTLDASEVVWTQGKDEANGIVGVGNFLPGTSLYDTKASPDGSKIITSGRFGKSSVVDARTGDTVLNVAGHSDSVIDAAWSPDGSEFFTASYDRHVRQFAADGTLLWDSGNVGQLAVGVDVSPDGGTLFIRRHEAPPMIVDLATKNVRTMPDAMKMVGDMDALEDGNVLYMQNDWERLRGPKNRVFIVDAATGEITWEGSLSGKQPTNAVATPSGQFVFAGIDDGSIVMFDRTKGVSSTIAGGSSYLRDMTMDATGTMLVVGTEQGVRVYDVEPLMTGSGAMPDPYVFPVTASSVTVSGSVAFVNNIYDNSSSRTIAIDLGKVPNVLKRLIAKETAVSPKAESTSEAKEEAPKIMVETIRAVNFSQLAAGELTETRSTGKKVNLPLIGEAEIFSGGPAFIRVMADGSLATGLYEGHISLHFKNLVLVESITMQKSGNGISKYNLGDGYRDLGARETTIPVGREINTVIILAGGTVEVKITGINIKVMEEAPAITPIDEIIAGEEILDAGTTLIGEIDTLTEPWSIGENDRLLSLTERASELRVASSALLTLLESLASIDDAVISDEQRSSLNQGLESAGEKLLTAMQERDLAEQEMWDAGLSDISPDLQEALLARASSVDDLRLLTSTLYLSGVTREFDGGSIVRDALEVLDAGGTIKIHGLQGRADTPLSQRLEAIDGETVVKETGQALAVDFSALTSPIVRTAFTVTSSEEADIVKVSFLSGSSVSEVQMVGSGETVSYEDAQGITGVMIENVRNILSADAEAYQEYLRTYRSNYMYSWQDPGPRYHFFNEVRKDLHPREAEIAAEVDRVKQIHPVSIGQLSVTSHTGENQETSMLSGETNALYAKMSVPEVTSFWFPNNRFSNITSVGYNKDAYNVYSLKRFSSAAGTIGAPTYVNAADEPRQLPKEFYKIIGDAVVVFPSGQDLRIGIGANSGTPSSASLRVGQNYDYDVLSTSGASLADVLPSSESRVGINDVTLFTVNQGGDAGWHEGASLEYSKASPVAVGDIKARARIENTGGRAIGFTVNVYSGNVGISGWDRVQQSYRGSLAAGDSRALVTSPLSLNTDSQGRSFIRFVVVADDGRILAEGGRTVGAAGGVMSEQDQNEQTADFMKNWEAAIVKAQAETKAFFVSRGEPVPAMGDIATFASRILAENTHALPLPDPATTERQMRLAFRALDAAKTSGNAERIALEQARFDNATAEHIASTGFVMVTPGSGGVKTVPDVVKNEEAVWKTPTGKLERAERELVLTRSALLASVDKLTELRIGGVQMEEKGNISFEKVGENLRKLSVADNASAIGNAGVVIEAGQPSVIELTITEDKMVSIGNLGRFGRNVNLIISGGSLPQEGYPSTKSEGFGDSVSLRLTPGTYTVTLDDVTNYSDQIHSSLKNTSFTTEVKIDIQKYNSANINGLISVEGRSAVMPVSMRVAEFIKDSSGKEIRNENYDGKDIGKKTVNQLDPSKPVWVVVHGRNDNENSGKMLELEKALTESGYQVVSINWKEAAKSFAGVQGEAWIQAVADWSYRMLETAKISGDNVHIAAHSWGSLVGDAIAKNFKNSNGFGVDTFVALDSAIDPSLRKYYDASLIDFSTISKTSTAFWSSTWGSEGRSHTAEHMIELRTNAAVSPLIIKNQTLKHGMAVTAFSNLLKLKRIDSNNPIASKFVWSSNESGMIPSRIGTDAWMYVDPYHEIGDDLSDEYIDAVPISMTLTDPDDSIEDLYFYNELKYLQ